MSTVPLGRVARPSFHLIYPSLWRSVGPADERPFDLLQNPSDCELDAFILSHCPAALPAELRVGRQAGETPHAGRPSRMKLRDAVLVVTVDHRDRVGPAAFWTLHLWAFVRLAVRHGLPVSSLRLSCPSTGLPRTPGIVSGLRTPSARSSRNAPPPHQSSGSPPGLCSI